MRLDSEKLLVADWSSATAKDLAAMLDWEILEAGGLETGDGSLENAGGVLRDLIGGCALIFGESAADSLVSARMANSDKCFRYHVYNGVVMIFVEKAIVRKVLKKRED